MSIRSVSFISVALLSLGGAAIANEGKVSKHDAPAPKPAPALAFSSPADESNVSATVPVRAVASQVDKVHSVTFYLDGVQLAESKAPGATFKWDTTQAGDGWHTLSAVATDEAGKTTEAQLAVMVHNFKDTSAPRIEITWPTDGNRKAVWISTKVHAVDNIAVTSVETYVDGKLVANSSVAPFETKWRWKNLSRGPHTIFCKAYDAAGNFSSSAVLNFTK